MFNIFSIFNKEQNSNKNEVIKFNDICFVEPGTNKKFLSITHDSSDYNQDELNKIGNVAKIDMFLQQLPLVANIVQSQQIKGAYKVVFPEGITGTLMKYKNGMLGTPFIGENGKIAGHAGLVPLDAAKVLSPVMIFSAISVVTGQYFMSRIDNSLLAISKDVKEIIDLIYDEKESDIYAIYDYYEYIKNNMATIVGNESLKIAVLSNIQLNNNKMNSNIKFYTKSIKRKINTLNNINEESAFTSKRLEMFQELNLKIEKLMNQQSLCYELFCVGKMLEVKIAEIYNREYYDNVINEFLKLGEELDISIYNLMNACETVLAETKKSAFINVDKVSEKILESSNQYRYRKNKLSSNVNSLIDSINIFLIDSCKEKEFYIIGDNLYTKTGV